MVTRTCWIIDASPFPMTAGEEAHIIHPSVLTNSLTTHIQLLQILNLRISYQTVYNNRPSHFYRYALFSYTFKALSMFLYCSPAKILLMVYPWLILSILKRHFNHMLLQPWTSFTNCNTYPSIILTVVMHTSKNIIRHLVRHMNPLSFFTMYHRRFDHA